MKKCLIAVCLFFWLVLSPGCDTIDCTLYNTVICNVSFYASGQSVSLTDTLTVTTRGVDSILINKQTSTSTMTLPLSYWQDEDTLVLTVTGSGYMMVDTIWIAKENMPHFESPDCPTTMFHHIQHVRTTHAFIDSVSIIQPIVNYDQTEHLQIHVYSGD